MWTSFYNGFHFRFFQLRLKTSFANQKHLYVTGLHKRELLLLYQHSSGVMCPTQDNTWCFLFLAEAPYRLLTYTAAGLRPSRADPDVFNHTNTHTQRGLQWQRTLREVSQYSNCYHQKLQDIRIHAFMLLNALMIPNNINVWYVCICLTQIFIGSILSIYYIRHNYMFRPFMVTNINGRNT